MNLYPNYNSLNNFFINNFNDYTKFINELDNLIFDDSLNIDTYYNLAD